MADRKRADYDIEVYGTGPFRWELFYGKRLVDSGHAVTRLGIQWGAYWAYRRDRKGRK